LSVALLVLGALAAPPHIAAEAAGQRPDIVVVMVDDLGAMDERVLERLPNIRELFLRGGRRFDAAVSETPLCCPARASFLTGQHTRRHGVFTNTSILALDPSQTLFTALDDVGYTTALVGKYLNGAHRLADKTPPGYDHVAMLHRQPTATASEWAVNGSIVYAGIHDRFVTDESIRWLTAAKDDAAPITLWASFFAPHAAPKRATTPWVTLVEAAYDNDPRCADIAPWMPPSYRYEPAPTGYPLTDICESLLTVDEFVGRAATLLAPRDPLWVFMSDNGMGFGAHGFAGKSNPFAARFPLYFAGRDVRPGTTDALVSNIDLGPTLAEQAGASMPWADGVSFKSALRGQPGGHDWMLEDFPVDAATGGPWRDDWWGVRTREWHLYVRPGRKPKLFDLTTDPWEMFNVASQNPAVVRELRSLARPLLY
jgi:arylsulfatase A-like enzyme